MNVYEIFKAYDRRKCAEHMVSKYDKYFSDVEKCEKTLKKFEKELKKLKYPKKLNKDYKDFVVVVHEYYEDYEIPYKNRETKEVDYEKLQKYFYTDGIHLQNLWEHQDELDITLEELKEKNQGKTDLNDMFHTWGLDLIPRKKLINFEICDSSIDRYGVDVVAGEIFWEMTFYGFNNETVKTKAGELAKSCKESSKHIKMSKFEDGSVDEEEMSKHFVDADELFEDIDRKEIEEELEFDMKALEEIGDKNRTSFNGLMKEYLQNYSEKIKGILEEKEKMFYTVSFKKYIKDLKMELEMEGYSDFQINYALNKFHFINKYRFKEVEDYDKHKERTLKEVKKEFKEVKEDLGRDCR